MYAVIKYSNSSHSVSFNILNVYNNFNNADIHAYEYAKNYYQGEEIVDYIEDNYVNIDLETCYTIDDSAERYVWAVIQIPQPEDIVLSDSTDSY